MQVQTSALAYDPILKLALRLMENSSSSLRTRCKGMMLSIQVKDIDVNMLSPFANIAAYQ